MATNALESAMVLYRQRNHAQVVTACRSELSARPDDVPVRILLARALMALRRDAEAQSEVSAALRHEPTCAEAYQLLGELAFRRDELRAAEIFLREALRLDEADPHSRVLLDIIQAMTKPASAAARHPAAAAAVGLSPLLDAAVLVRAVGSQAEPLPSAPRALLPRRRRPVDAGDATRLITDESPSVVLRVRGGFGEFLVDQGMISRAQLFAALHLHYRERCKVGDAVVRLGFAGRDPVEAAAVRYHADTVPMGLAPPEETDTDPTDVALA